MSKGRKPSWLLAAVISIAIGNAKGRTVAKNETAVGRGATIHLPCAVAKDNTNVETLSWIKPPFNRIWEGFDKHTSEKWASDKFGLTGIYDLVINDIDFKDAGQYRCLEEDEETGAEATHRWTVYVLGQPRCHVAAPPSSFIQLGEVRPTRMTQVESRLWVRRRPRCLFVSQPSTEDWNPSTNFFVAPFAHAFCISPWFPCKNLLGPLPH